MSDTVYVHSTVLALRELHRELVDLDYGSVSILDCLSQQAFRLADAHQQGNNAVAFHLGSWCHEVIGLGAEKIMNETFTLAQMQQTIASEYGYADWSAVQALGDVAHNQAFEQAVDATITGNLDSLQKQLVRTPELTTQRSQYGHRSTLLHYLGANGVESHRQITPYNAIDVAACLLDAGADINATANMYGGGTRTLGLVETSAHPHHAGVAEQLAAFLRERGSL